MNERNKSGKERKLKTVLPEMRLRERAQQLLDPDVTVQKPIAKKHSMDHSMYVMLI